MSDPQCIVGFEAASRREAPAWAGVRAGRPPRPTTGRATGAGQLNCPAGRPDGCGVAFSI